MSAVIMSQKIGPLRSLGLKNPHFLELGNGEIAITLSCSVHVRLCLNLAGWWTIGPRNGSRGMKAKNDDLMGSLRWTCTINCRFF